MPLEPGPFDGYARAHRHSVPPLGREVRCDRGHERDAFLVEVFGRYVEWRRCVPKSKWGSVRRGVPCA